MFASVQSTSFRLTAALFSLLLFVVLVEIVVRVAGIDVYFQNRFFVLNRALDYPEVFARDAELFWRLRPDRSVTSHFFEDKTYRINRLGLRGEEIADHKVKKRILALGNSCTFGWGVSADKTYPDHLEKLLGNDYEVINAGVPGYSTLQGKRLFERELLDLQPDIVTIMFAWNDQWAASGQIPDKAQRFPPSFILELQNLLSRMHSYRLLKKLILSRIEVPPDSAWDRDSIVYRVSGADFAANLTAICRTCLDHGITPILLTSPAPSLDRYGHSRPWAPAVRFHHRYNDRTRAVAEQMSVLLIDAAEELDRYDAVYDDVRHDFIHFNAHGHRIIAEMVKTKILELPVK